jgi:hypothetical protein
VRHIVRNRSAASDPTARFIRANPNKPYSSCELEERFLDAGEMLYVLGRVERRAPVAASGSYRSPEDVPIVGGSPDRPLIVHAGTEQSLLRTLRRERLYLDLTLAAFVTVASALVVLVVGAVVAW